MPVQYIVGPSGSGKTEYIMNEISTSLRLSEDENLFLIVPQQFSLEAEKNLILKTSQKGIMNAQAISLKHLAFRIFKEKGGMIKKILSETGKTMLIRKILFALTDSLVVFKKSADKKGFINHLSATLTEFYHYQITPDMLTANVAAFGEQNELKYKVEDLAVIYQAYNAYLKEQFISTDDALDIVSEKVKGSHIVQNAVFYFDGFYSFTPQEIKVITEILKYAKRVVIAVTMDKKSLYKQEIHMEEPFYESKMMLQKIEKIAASHKIARENTIKLDKMHRFQNDELKFLSAYFLQYTNKTYQGETRYIKITEANNKYEEITNIAENIVQLVQNENLRFRDVALLTSSLEEYENIIKSVFFDYEIPFFIDKNRDVHAHPLVGLLRALLDICQYNFQYDSVFGLLKTGLLPIDVHKIDKLENYVLAFGIKGYKWNLDWAYVLDYYEDFDLEQINDTKKELLSYLAPFTNYIKKNKKYKINFIANKIYDFLEKCSVEKTLSGWFDSFTKENEHTKAFEQIQIFNVIGELFEKMENILGEEEITVGEFIKIFDAGLSSCDMGVIPLSLDQVIVGDIERSRLGGIQALFMAGASDGLLPNIKEPDSLLGDEDRKSLTLTLSTSGRRKIFEQFFLIYQALSSPSQFLQISYPLSGLSGKSLRASMIIRKIKNLFPGLQISKAQGQNNYLSSKHAAFQQLALEMKSSNFVPNSFWKDVYVFFSKDPTFKNKLSLLRRGMEERKQEFLSTQSIEKIYGNQFYSSVSRVEKYHACPFSYFMEYGLSAKQRKVYDVSFPDLGILFHHVLYQYGVMLKEEGFSFHEMEEKQMQQYISYAVDEFAKGYLNNVMVSTKRNEYMIKRIKRIAGRAIWALTEHFKRGQFEVIGNEISFGDGGTFPPIVVELADNQKILLLGRIDRVDIFSIGDDNYVKILDYKSGTKGFSLESVFYGLELQLLLYMYSILHSGRIDHLYPAGVFYFKITDPILSESDIKQNISIEKEVLKKLKLDGLLLENMDIIKAMDGLIETERKSLVVPANLKTDGSLGAFSSVADKENFDKILLFAYKKVKEAGEKMVTGNINVRPYKNKKGNACQFCEYGSVCQFDPGQGNQYNTLKPISDDEFYKMIQD